MAWGFRGTKAQSPTFLSGERIREHGKQASRHVALLGPGLLAAWLVNRYRVELFGVDLPVRIATAVLFVVVGWAFARALGRALRPRLMKMDPSAAGAVGWAVRLLTMASLVLIALKLAGLRPATLAVSASFTAIVLGLAAQQTFGNMMAGLVLLSARPFQVGDRVRFAGFGMDVEGTVAAHGLLYVTMTDGADTILVPNNTALTMSVRPLREPSSVDFSATFTPDVEPVFVEKVIKAHVTVDTRYPPDVSLEEFTDEQVTLRIRATPQIPEEGGMLASQVMRALHKIIKQQIELERQKTDSFETVAV